MEQDLLSKERDEWETELAKERTKAQPRRGRKGHTEEEELRKEERKARARERYQAKKKKGPGNQPASSSCFAMVAVQGPAP